MAKADLQKKQVENQTKKKRHQWHSEKSSTFKTVNYVGLGIGILTIVVGFILLSAGSMTLAPLLLVLGFSFFIPIAVLMGIGKGGDVQERIKESGGKMD